MYSAILLPVWQVRAHLWNTGPVVVGAPPPGVCKTQDFQHLHASGRRSSLLSYFLHPPMTCTCIMNLKHTGSCNSAGIMHMRHNQFQAQKMKVCEKWFLNEVKIDII